METFYALNVDYKGLVDKTNRIQKLNKNVLQNNGDNREDFLCPTFTLNQKDNTIVFDKRKIGIKLKLKWAFYDYPEIVSIYSDSNYTAVKINDNKVHYVSLSLKEFIRKLPKIFFQCNRSQILNIAYMRSYQIVNKKITIEIQNGEKYAISRLNKQLFLKHLAELSSISLPCENCHFCVKHNKCPDLVPFRL